MKISASAQRVKWPIYLILFLLLIFSNTSYGEEQVNDIRRLKETVNTLGEAIMSDNANPPALFMISLDEFRKVVLNVEKNATENDIVKRFEKNNSRINSRYAELKREMSVIKAIVSFDTISGIREKTRFIDVSIAFTSIDKWTKEQNTTRVLMSFLLINNQLKILGTIRPISFLHYTLHELDKVYSLRQESFYDMYPLYFKTSTDNVIPFEKKRKWGLVSLKNEVRLEPLYDSISPFVLDYACVKTKDRYNLIDRNFKLVFAKSKLNIKLVDKKYWMVADQKGQYTSYPPVAEQVEEIMMEGVQVEEIAVAKPAEMMDAASRVEKELSENYYKRADYTIKHSDYKPNQPDTHWVVSNFNSDTLSTHHGFLFIDPHGDYLIGNRNDTTFVMTPAGKVLFKSHYVCTFESPGYLKVFDRKTRFFGLYCPYTNVYIKPEYTYIKPIDRDQFFVVLTTKGKMGYLDGAGKELFERK